MFALALVDDVDRAVRVEVVAAVKDGRDVGRRVQIGAVFLADDERGRIPVGVPLLLQLLRDDVFLAVVPEDADGAVVLSRDPLFEELVDHVRERVVIGALPQPLVEAHAERVVDPVERHAGRRDELLPEGVVFRVAALELRQLRPRRFSERLVALRLVAREAVDALELDDGVPLQGRFVAPLAHPHDEQAELRAPVAEVIVADHVVADRAQEPTDRVADDRRAEVSDVHLLGDVRARVVDDDLLGRVDLLDAEALVREVVREPRRDPGWLEAQVHEPRPGDLRRRDGLVLRERFGEGRSDLPWRLLQLLRQRHRRVDLVVAVLFVTGGAQERRLALPGRLLDDPAGQRVQMPFDPHVARDLALVELESRSVGGIRVRFGSRGERPRRPRPGNTEGISQGGAEEVSRPGARSGRE